MKRIVAPEICVMVYRDVTQDVITKLGILSYLLDCTDPLTHECRMKTGKYANVC